MDSFFLLVGKLIVYGSIFVTLIAILLGAIVGAIRSFVFARKAAWSWMVPAKLARYYQTDQNIIARSFDGAFANTKWSNGQPSESDVHDFLENLCMRINKNKDESV